MYVHRVPQDGRRVVTATVDGVPAVVLNWRTTCLRIPLATAASLVVFSCAVGIVGLRDGNGAGWLGVAFAGLLAPTVPDRMMRMRRHPRLVLTPQGIGARGWDGDSWLDWDDVAGVRFVDVAQYTVLRVIGAPHAPRGVGADVAGCCSRPTRAPRSGEARLGPTATSKRSARSAHSLSRPI